MPGPEKVYWVIAIFSSLIFILQTLMSVVGFGDADVDGGDFASVDTEIDLHAGPVLEYVSVRNIVAFFLGLSWGALASLGSGLPLIAASFIGCVIGAFFVGAVMTVLKLMGNLKSDGTLSLENAVDQEGTVTVPIPPNMEGTGKVHIVIQGRLVELQAVTTDETLARGQQVVVIEISGNRLVVQKVW